TSATGKNVIPSPYGRHLPLSTTASAATPPRNSSTSLDFPTPAGPSSVNRWHSRSDTARSNDSRIRASSRSLPTIGESRLRAWPAASRLTSNEPVRRHRLGLALELERRDRLDPDGVTDEPVGG